MLFDREDRRFIRVVFKLLVVGVRYRSDRKKILKAEGKITNPEKPRAHGRKAVEFNGS